MTPEITTTTNTTAARGRRPVGRTSVRARLALWNVFVLALALAGAGFLLREQVASDLYSGVDTLLQQRLHPLPRWAQRHHSNTSGTGGEERGGPRPNGGSGGGGGGGGPMGGPPGSGADDALARQRRMEFAPRLLGREGDPLFADEHPLLAWDKGAVATAVRSGKPFFSTIYHNGSPDEPYRVYTLPVSGDNGAIGRVLQVAAPLAGIRQTVDQLTRTLLTLIPFALLVAGGGAVFLTDRALRPVREVTRAAAQIEASDLSQRLDVRGDDDFAHLADRFNGMLGRLEEAFARREAALEQQTRFVADASHELRTPLTVIKANTSLALADPDLSGDYRDVLNEIDSAVDRTIHIARDLFLLAKSDSGQITVDASDLPVRPLLEQVQNEMRRAHPDGAFILVEIDEKGASKSASGKDPAAAELASGSGHETGGALSVWGDRSHLLRLLTNLTENALRHTPPTGAIYLRARAASGGDVTLEVADTGEGIAPEHLAHVTERFYRVDTARAREAGGTGLGLAICQAIAEAHGGDFAIESKLGVGTTVRVTLPGAPSEE